jgi:2-succinyl-5-enolpyruvyl-6-hydroxy-3-cyclohexene-1-carboxylate synthase
MLPEPVNAGHAFAIVLVDELARHGVRDAVLAPGSRSTPIALALAGDERVRLHVRIDERSAAFLALGLAKGSGRVVPVLCTSGTAAAHFLAAALEADQSQVPLLLLTADRPPELRGTGANQTVDQVGLYGGAVRWAADIGVPESRPDAVAYWRSVVSRAALTARNGGPVHLNLPLREPLTPTDDGVGFAYPLDGRPDGEPWITDGSVGGGELSIDIRDVIADARRGVVVAGDGLDHADVNGVLDFAAARGWPVIAEPHSNARRGPCALRCTDAVISNDAFAPDLVVVAGRIGLSRALLGFVGRNRSVAVDGRGRRWPDPTRTAAYVAHVPPAALRDVGGKPADAEWLDAWRDASAAAGDAIDAVLDESPTLTEPLVAREVVAAVPDDTALVVASSMPIRDLDLTMRPRDGIHVFANRGVSGIDGFVSTAVGIALVHKEKTVALAGDLSLLHDINGLLLRDGYPIDLTVVVVNNDGGGIFSLLPQADTHNDSFERLFGTPHGVDLAAVVTAYGATHRLVHDVAELRAAVGADGEGIRVVEVRTDRAANADLHRRLRAEAAAAVAAGTGHTGTGHTSYAH